MINRIDGPGSLRPTTTVRRAGKTSSASGSSFSKHLDETSETSATGSLSGAGAVTGVLGVQEVDDALAHASKGKLRAEDILDRLEDLRLDVLTGAISRDKLLQLAHVVNSRKAQVTDPRLVELLDEIDLRAQVELAKYAQQHGGRV